MLYVFPNFFFKNLKAIYFPALTHLKKPWYFILMLRIHWREWMSASDLCRTSVACYNGDYNRSPLFSQLKQQQNNKEFELFSTEALKGLQKHWGPLWLMQNRKQLHWTWEAGLWEQAPSSLMNSTWGRRTQLSLIWGMSAGTRGWLPLWSSLKDAAQLLHRAHISTD